MGTRAVRMLLVVVALAVAVLGTACAPREATAYNAINELRDAHRLHGLEWNEAVHDKAVAWSAHMADEGRLSHSTLSEGIPAGWSALGENVAVAGSVEHAIDLLEASPPHAANMLNPEFTSVAVGIVERDGRIWMTQVFVG